MHRAIVDGERHGPRDRRPDHAAVQHPWHLDVGDVVELAEDLGWDFETWRRLADDLAGAGRLGLRLPFGDEIVASIVLLSSPVSASVSWSDRSRIMTLR
jgi:hypothetical protein